MRNCQEVSDANRDEKDSEARKKKPRLSARGSIRRPLRFGDLDDAQASMVRELTAPRDNWLGCEPEY